MHYNPSVNHGQFINNNSMKKIILSLRKYIVDRVSEITNSQLRHFNDLEGYNLKGFCKHSLGDIK